MQSRVGHRHARQAVPARAQVPQVSLRVVLCELHLQGNRLMARDGASADTVIDDHALLFPVSQH